MAKVRIAQQYPLALLGKENGEVPAEKALPLAVTADWSPARNAEALHCATTSKKCAASEATRQTGSAGWSNAGSGDFAIQSAPAGEGSLFLLIRQHA